MILTQNICHVQNSFRIHFWDANGVFWKEKELAVQQNQFTVWLMTNLLENYNGKMGFQIFYVMDSNVQIILFPSKTLHWHHRNGFWKEFWTWQLFLVKIIPALCCTCNLVANVMQLHMWYSWSYNVHVVPFHSNTVLSTHAELGNNCNVRICNDGQCLLQSCTYLMRIK